MGKKVRPENFIDNLRERLSVKESEIKMVKDLLFAVLRGIKEI